jgi:hypothetical protein
MLRTPAIALLLAVGAAAQIVPDGFTVDTLLSDSLIRPTDLCFLPDGRCLIATMPGTIVVYASGAYGAIGAVPSVSQGGESGLLSIVADPQFATNGHVYVWYTSTLDASMHLDRYTLLGPRTAPTSANLTLDVASRRVVLNALPNQAAIHNGGSLRFGPDGKLYVSVGDDADSCNAPFPTSGVGCVLRLDVAWMPSTPSAVAPTYSQLDPGTNPLSANTGVAQLVVASGLRNPFRMEIDELTGNLYVGDVGEALSEELNEYVRGAGNPVLRDFGWSRREGLQPGPGCPTDPTAAPVDPIFAEFNAAGWKSIMAGPCYRNRPQVSGFGPSYEGHVFVTDYYSGEIRRLVKSGAAWQVATPVAGQPATASWATGFTNTCALRMGPDGCLWFVRNFFFGEIGRIRRNSVQNGLLAMSGNGQRVATGDVFPSPVVVRALDALGHPVANTAITFSVQGGATLQTPMSVLTDATGHAQATLAATAAGGPVRVFAIQATNGATAAFDLYVRRLTATHAAPQLSIGIANTTDASPAQVPYILLTGFPGVASLATPVGSLCINPTDALAVVMEDGVGVFGGVSLSGNGGTGSPSLNVQYALPPGLLTGLSMRFQAIGLDPITGWFRTNCASIQF